MSFSAALFKMLFVPLLMALAIVGGWPTILFYALGYFLSYLLDDTEVDK